MKDLNYQDLYNEDYYLNMVPGIPYDRVANDGHWLHFFNKVADKLINYLQPKTVLDVGCAKGFLLEAFYNRSVSVFGFDYSEYAISCMREDLKPFAFVSSATKLDAFRKYNTSYDLITCIEVVEHMPIKEAICAIKNMCLSTNTIFFSSTSDDFLEPTHLTVLPRVNWLKFFLDCHFVPDYSFKLCEIPHGILLRKINDERKEISKLIELHELNLDDKKNCIDKIESQLLETHSELEKSKSQLLETYSELEKSKSQLLETHSELEKSKSQLLETHSELEKSKSQLLETYSELEKSRNIISWMETSKFWKLRLTYINIKKYVLSSSLAASGKHTFNDIKYKNSSITLADSPEYEEWIKSWKVNNKELDRQKAKAFLFEYKPCLSVIIPVYKLPLYILKEAVNSVLQQSYTNWELCIAFADTNNLKTIDYLQKLSLQDNRVKLNIMSQNKGISANSNVSLQMASGEFVVLLDHDDLLSPSAFYEVICELNKQPDLDFIYSDKDCISEDSIVRSRLLLKPQWSPEILYSANYVTHLCVARRDLVLKIGGFRSEMDGAQDWDLFFRITEQTSRISRIHSVLYHWRIIQGSTSLGIDSKPYALEAQLRSIQEHLVRIQIPASVSPHPECGFRLKWTTPPARVSIIIDGSVPWDSLSDCIKAVSEFADYRLHKAIVVLPESTYDMHHNALEILSKNSHIDIDYLIVKEGEHKLTVLSEAAKQNITDVVLFVSGKVIRFEEGWIQELSNWVLNHPDIGFASALVLADKNIIVEAGLVVDKLNNGYPLLRGTKLYSWGIFGGALWYRNCSASSPWAIAFSYKHYLSLGGLDTDSISLLHSTIRLCQASCANKKRGLVNPHARVFLADLPSNDIPEFHETLAEDPYFHPAFDSVVPLKLRLKNEDHTTT